MGQKAFEEKPQESQAAKHYPVMQQLKKDLDGLKAETLPDLQSQMNELQQATREILELLRPHGDFDLPHFGDVIRTEEFAPGIPDLPSQPSAVPSLSPSPLPELLHVTEVSPVSSPKRWSAPRQPADLKTPSSNGGGVNLGFTGAP